LGIIEKRLRELWEEKIDAFRKFFYETLDAGNTPLTKLDFNDKTLYLKREDLEPTGSVKIRAAAGIHFLNRERVTSKKTYITLASSGNFAKDLPYVIKKDGLDVPIKVFISEKIKDENPEIIKKIYGEIYPVDDDYCPANKRKRGKAITFAKVEEELFGAIMYNQYEDYGNPFANLLLGEEIAKAVDNPEDIVIYVGLGTCGTAIGIYYGFYFASGVKPEFYGVIPQEDHHQLGLRSLSEHGESEFFKEVKSFSKKIIEVSDRDAFSTMLNLWRRGIPAGISTGTNVFSASTNDSPIAITLMPDSIRGLAYKSFLEKYLPDILGINLTETPYHNFQREQIATRF